MTCAHMQYDDIANNTENPNPGVIINHPNGPNVYEGRLLKRSPRPSQSILLLGVKIDYRQADVTPENFLNILEGKAAAMKGRSSSFNPPPPLKFNSKAASHNGCCNLRGWHRKGPPVHRQRSCLCQLCRSRRATSHCK